MILAEAASQHIELRYDLIDRTPNTRMAHRLVEWIGQCHGWHAQHEIAESLFQAYFCDGKDLGDFTTLAALAEPHGLHGRQAQEVLQGTGEPGQRLNEEIDVQLHRATELGVSGVPGYVMGGAYLLPGAQSVETMRAIISRAKESSQLSPQVTSVNPWRWPVRSRHRLFRQSLPVRRPLSRLAAHHRVPRCQRRLLRSRQFRYCR